MDKSSTQYSTLVIGDVGVSNNEIERINEIEPSFTDGAEEGLERIEQNTPSILICGNLDSETGVFEFISKVNKLYPEMVLIVCTPNGSEELAGECANIGVADYIAVQEPENVRKRVTNVIETMRQNNPEIGRLREIHNITSNTELSPRERIIKILDIGCEWLNLELGFITEIDTDAETQLIALTNSRQNLVSAGETCSLNKAYCRKTIQQDELLTVYQAGNDPEWAGDAAYQTWGLEAYLGGKVIVEGELYGTVCFADTTPRKQKFTDEELTLIDIIVDVVTYELTREKFTNELKEKNQRLESFVSIVSHDLRNPINVASGRLDLYKETGEEENLQVVEQSLDRMERMITDLLWLSREGKQIGKTSEVSLQNVVDESWKYVSTKQAKMRFTNNVLLSADSDRLTQLLENLFRNSIEHGGKDVTIEIGGLDGDSGFYVEDDGPGIPDHIKSDVFESGVTTTDNGTGYGLAIVQQISEAHGWKVSVCDAENRGARFEFQFGE